MSSTAATGVENADKSSARHLTCLLVSLDLNSLTKEPRGWQVVKTVHTYL